MFSTIPYSVYSHICMYFLLPLLDCLCPSELDKDSPGSNTISNVVQDFDQVYKSEGGGGGSGYKAACL